MLESVFELLFIGYTVLLGIGFGITKIVKVIRGSVII